jgi:hypothetical protein
MHESVTMKAIVGILLVKGNIEKHSRQ